MTVTERVKQINAGLAERAKAEDWIYWGTLTEDPAHWAEYGVHTSEEVDQYLAWEDYVDTYKDVHNIKPRWTGWRDHTSEEWTQMARSL